jgi:hypothetical protein
LRISETERCPNIIARIDNGNANRKRPQTKLAIALPLVCAGKTVPSAAGPSTGASVEFKATSFPHTLQNFSPTPTVLPQPEQNTLSVLLKRHPIEDTLPKLSETLLFRLWLVN